MLKITIDIDKLHGTYEREFTITQREAKIIAKILLDNAKEWETSGDLKAAQIGSLLKEYSKSGKTGDHK